MSNASKHLNLIYGLNSIHWQRVTQKRGEMHKEGEEGRASETKIRRIKETVLKQDSSYPLQSTHFACGETEPWGDHTMESRSVLLGVRQKKALQI